MVNCDICYYYIHSSLFSIAFKKLKTFQIRSSIRQGIAQILEYNDINLWDISSRI